MMKNTGKKPKEKYDSHLPRTRCTSAERAAINARAAQAGVTPSEYMRRIALTGQIIIKESKFDTGLYKLLYPIANNINQYIKRVHIRGLTAYEHDLLFSCFDKLNILLDRLINDTEN